MRHQSFLFPSSLLLCVFLSFLPCLYFSDPKSEWQQSAKQKQPSSTNEEMRNVLKMLQSVDFEVLGRVQGVFFRKFTREKGKELGLKGWVMNTHQGTVVGTMQGKEEKIEIMKHWLRHTGSPMSSIEKCIFTNDRHISKEEFEDFHLKY